MVESTGPTAVAPAEDEKARVLTNYRKKLVEYRDIEQQLKQLRKKVGYILSCWFLPRSLLFPFVMVMIIIRDRVHQ